MTRIASIDPAAASGRAKELLDSTKAQLGRIPNLYGSMAQSPATLDGYLAFRGALGKGVLSVQMRERIALLTAAINDCGYCVSAHTFRGSKIGLSASELAATQQSRSEDPKSAAALQFVDALLERRGLVSDDDYANVKSHGWSDEEIGEMVAHVALNVFSNYFNHVAKPALDFPAAEIAR
ncbi:MAG: carboxymuconolactone decarboxylase family protein [Gammaproteobacteria bacterium]|nr:carboxymuconolactone decarboxylase family protein [Gammaproteobacteria bacterium]